jgi:DNA-binding LacI/PurR family transcriptional regulator
VTEGTTTQRFTAEHIGTRLLTLDADRAYNYHEDQLAYRSIAVVFTHWTIADDEHDFFGPLVRGLRNRAATMGCDLTLCSPSRDHWLEAAAVERVVAHGADGIIVLGGSDGNPDVLTEQFDGLATVFVEFDSIGSRSGHVSIDNEAAFSEAVIHLATTGHHRIATITGQLDMRVSAERLAAHRGVTARLGYPLPAAYVETGDFRVQSGYDATQRLLALPEPPDAIACQSDAMAVGAIRAIEDAGLRCPDDVAVTGFDDARYAAQLTPALTTVRQPAAEMGRIAVETLVAMMDEPAMRPPSVQVPAELVVRESCGARSH